MTQYRTSRRRLLKTGAATALLGALPAPFVARFALGQSKFDWQRFSGKTIDVLLVKNPRSDLMQAAEKEFTELTGIKVSSEQVPEQQQRQKAVIEFTSGKPSFDVAHLSLHVQKRLSAKGKWLEDLRPILEDASLTAPDFDFADFGKAGLSLCTAGRRPASIRLPIIRRLLDALLQQGAVRREGRRLPEDHGRDVHRGAEADTTPPRASPASSRAG